MIKILKSFVVILGILFLVSQPNLIYADQIPPDTRTQKEIISDYVTQYSKEYGVSATKMNVTIACESSFNPNAVGDFGKSFGLVQIYLPAHPEISKEQALNPKFAIEFMAKEFSKGNARIWSCYRMKY